MNRMKIGTQEMVCLVSVTIIAKLFYIIPVAAKLAGTAYWYMTLVSASVAALGLISALFLIKKTRAQKSLMEIYDTALGKVIGKTFTLLTCAVYFIILLLGIEEFIEVIHIYVFDNIHVDIMEFFLFATVIALSFIGLEGLARFSKIAAFAIAGGLLFVLLSAWQHYDAYRLFPLFGYGIGNTLKLGAMNGNHFIEIMAVPVYINLFNNYRQIKRTVWTSLAISAAVISVVSLCTQLTFTYFLKSELVNPLFIMISNIKFGLFFQRVESFFLIFWTISAVISYAFIFNAVLSLYCHIFSIKDKRPIVFPVAIILFTLGLALNNIMIVIDFLRQYNIYMFIIIFVLPAVVLIITKIRRNSLASRDTGT